MKDWAAWHTGYDDPSSSLSARLTAVRSHLSLALDRAPAGQIRLVSLCAGQGRDVIGVLPSHRRREDVTAVLVESDQRNAEVAARSAATAGLVRVEVRLADAGLVPSFADALPADVLLLCGIFGNVTSADIERTVRSGPALCAPGATVIWTRHRRAPDLTPRIREWFAAGEFEQVAFDALGTTTLTGVGVNRLPHSAQRLRLPDLADRPLFTFRADDSG